MFKSDEMKEMIKCDSAVKCEGDEIGKMRSGYERRWDVYIGDGRS